MSTRTLSAAFALSLLASTGLATVASADTLTMWVRASGTNAASTLVNLWNSTHPDTKIELTTIPDNQMVTKLATGVQAADVPDLVSFDLIYMPDFMKAGFLTDLTADLKGNKDFAGVAKAYVDIATYEGKIYGAGFTPDVSILVWNKDLFKKAGLDPEKPPQSIGELHEDAKKIHALGPDVYGYYFSGSCPGCNIFTMSPIMVAAGSKLLPANGNDDALTGDGVKTVLEEVKAMWKEGLVPKSAQADNGADFVSLFKSGKVGIQGAGGFLISDLKKDVPDMNFGVAFLPGAKAGQASAFVGGDVVAVPVGSKHVDKAKAFIAWELTDEAQLEGLAKNNIIPSRPALADNKYFQAEPRVVTTAKALGVGYVPWVFHFNEMVNSDSSPWINMLQRAIFDGDVDGAIKEGREKMKAIAAQ
jgi:multiple sugar transport system substrate-binding protein